MYIVQLAGVRTSLFHKIVISNHTVANCDVKPSQPLNTTHCEC